MASFTLSQETVQGQVQPEGLVTLTAPAPVGNAVVALSSSFTDAAKVPATVSVPAGSRTAAFTIDTSSVSNQAVVTLSASYAGVTRTAVLTVTPPPLIPRLAVSSPSKGADACSIIDATGTIDCQLDGSASGGRVSLYHWTLRFNGREVNSSVSNAVSTISTDCAFFAPSSVGASQLTVLFQLRVEDQSGARSGLADRTVIVYTNDKCGF